MKLILSDKYLNLDVSDHSNTKFIDLSSLNIANCTGCFGCWTKTPGKCVIRDDATKVYPYIAKSDNLIYISKILYGGYDTPMKTMLERAIPIQKAFIRILNGETHHVQRSVELKNATIIAYGEIGTEEKEIVKAKKIVDATAEALRENKGVFTVDGKMVDKPIIERAQRVLELAKAAGVLAGGEDDE